MTGAGAGAGSSSSTGQGAPAVSLACLVQVQNLPRNYLPDLAEARSLVRTGDFDAVELLYDSVPDTLS